MASVSVVDVTKALKGLEFPVDKDDLIEHARDNGADEDVLQLMQDMPEEEFATVAEVMHAVGEANRMRTAED